MLTPKENYLKVLKGEIPEYIPSYYEPYSETMWLDLYFKPVYVTDGFAFSPWGVRYVGTKELGNGGIPEPNFIILRDITTWRDVIKNPDLRHIDCEQHYKKATDGLDRANKALVCNGGEYFQTLVSFMGFQDAVIAMVEEPDEVYALLDYISEFNIAVARERIRYTKPDIYMISDDCAAAHSPFISPAMYKKLIKPFHRKHAELALEHGLIVSKHDCGKSEAFIPDWVEMGVRAWNPAQPMNDLKAVKREYNGRLTIEGGWDSSLPAYKLTASDDELIAALDEYVDTFAPGGSFVYSAMPFFLPATDENAKRKSELVRKYFFENVRDYYKKH